MKKKSRGFIAVDIILIAMIILPFVAAIVIEILTAVPSEGISVSGAQIFFTIPMPLQDLPITESQVNTWLVMISIVSLCLFLTHGISEKADLKRQHAAEWIVEQCDKMVNENMGEYFKAFGPFIAAILGLSAFSSLISLLGLYPPTSDINITGGWAVLVFVLITYYKFKCGPWGYLKSFAEPVAILTPINIISEVATPVSMAFRHYGNVLSGSVISVLLASALGGLSKLVLGFLPDAVASIGFLRIGIPGVLSLYFDVFSGCLQAYIFAMLTMMYVGGAFNMEEYFKRKEKKKNKKAKVKNGGNVKC